MAASEKQDLGDAHQGSVRIERDSMGEIAIDQSRYWGAQTQRSIENFPIGRDRFQFDAFFIEALAMLKRAAAQSNEELGRLEPRLAKAIVAAADEIIEGRHRDEFPLVVWQTGSGTQSNMNMNEVLANRANELLGEPRGTLHPVHPNDHVNRGQSSNDVIPTAMYVALSLAVQRRLMPELDALGAELARLGQANADIIKVGRTHLQDATPITLGQEIGAWEAQIAQARSRIDEADEQLRRNLAIGGTATGTGLNTSVRFGPLVAAKLAEATGWPFAPAGNLFAATAAHDDMVMLSASLRILAGAAFKMANDIRLLASGPRNGIGEIRIPNNEPGSSIMPGKVNPTQAEALTMVAAQVIGNDATVGFAGTQGHFQLNVFKPVMYHNVAESIALLSDALESFRLRCLQGLMPDREHIAWQLEHNLMVVTALNPHIGYDQAAMIAKTALAKGISLRQAGVELDALTEAEFDAWVRPELMTKPDR